MTTQEMQLVEFKEPKARPDNFMMQIQGGMLDALGINMYSTLAKSMVEFVANAFDSEATYVDITIPFKEIATARAKVREDAKEEVAAGRAEPFTLLLLPLPEQLEIVITDDGHGMDPLDVSTKFLPVNRKRRLNSSGKEKQLLSEGGKRKVMGRKGLGKLAGFGVAERVTIKTKRREDAFWTVFELDYDVLSKSPNLGQVDIPAHYPLGDIGVCGTIITLSKLRCDAFKRGHDELENTLRQNFFGVRPEDFAIKVNAEVLAQPIIEYDFEYPPDRDATGFAGDIVEVEDVGELNFRYVVRFRKSGNSLRSDLRGARIYCHNRLAAGPSLFRLPSGVHNYHGQDYLECIVEANELDELGIDFVSTDRTQLKEESELVIRFIERITEILKLSLAAHYRHKDSVVESEIKAQQPTWVKVIDRMDRKAREPARKILKALGTQFGVGSSEFNEIAPLVMDTMNAGEVLVRLIEIGANPTEINAIANALRDLAEVEKSQALTVFRGRRQAINALRQLADRGDDEWRKAQFENELHDLFKKQPWLIRQEFSHHLTSDENLETVCSQLAKELRVDHFVEDSPKAKALRPDLVHLMSDAALTEVCIVELKSPSIPLVIDNLTQLQGYMADVEAWLSRKFTHNVAVTGYLIGTRESPTKRTRDAQTLEARIAKAGIESDWKVFDLRDLIRKTESAHADIIASLESELGEDHILTSQKSGTAKAVGQTMLPALPENVPLTLAAPAPLVIPIND